MVALDPFRQIAPETWSGSVPNVAAPVTFETGIKMNPYRGETQEFIQFRIPLTMWAAIALALGIFAALLIVLGSAEI